MLSYGEFFIKINTCYQIYLFLYGVLFNEPDPHWSQLSEKTLFHRPAEVSREVLSSLQACQSLLLSLPPATPSTWVVMVRLRGWEKSSNWPTVYHGARQPKLSQILLGHASQRPCFQREQSWASVSSTRESAWHSSGGRWEKARGWGRDSPRAELLAAHAPSLGADCPQA